MIEKAKLLTGGAGLGIVINRAFDLLREYVEGSPCEPIEAAFSECRRSLQSLYETLLR